MMPVCMFHEMLSKGGIFLTRRTHSVFYSLWPGKFAQQAYLTHGILFQRGIATVGN